MNGLKTAVCASAGIFGTWIVNIFGGWNKDMTTLITLMAIDFVTGLVTAVVFGRSPKTASGAASSNSCFEGICKKLAMLLFVLIAHRLDVTLGVNYIKTAAVIGFIVNETLSVIENAGLMGIPLPKAFSKAVDLLRSDDDCDGE